MSGAADRLRRHEAKRLGLCRTEFKRSPAAIGRRAGPCIVKGIQRTPGAADPGQHRLGRQRAGLVEVRIERQDQPRRAVAAARKHRDLRPRGRDQPRRRPGEELGLLAPARVEGGDLRLEASLESEGHHPEGA